MQSVDSAFTATERALSRQIAQNLQISWHKQSTVGNRTFTIGVSIIGGNDVIGINPGAIGSPANYKYFDESASVISLGWERGFNLPTGGLAMGLGEAVLDNTTGRYTPRYMGGNSEISTAIQPSKPVIISAGFNIDQIDQMIPQFVGTIDRQPSLDLRSLQMSLTMKDYINFFSSKYLDQAVMFTGQRTDQVLETLLIQLGMSTSQYELDVGINTIPFGVFDVNTKFADAIDQLVQAEAGNFYQDEQGIFRFENRQHWYSEVYSTVQRVIATSQVIEAQAPDDDHLINQVEITTPVYQKIAESVIYKSAFQDSLTLPSGVDTDIFVNFSDPTLSVTIPTGDGISSYFKVNTASDGSGSDITGNCSISRSYIFAQSGRLTFHNSSGQIGYITDLQITGRQAKQVKTIDYKDQNGASVTAYQEHPITIDNPFIQNDSLAASIASLLLAQYSKVENLQVIKIRAIPELQNGDLVSWQGNPWRIFDIKSVMDVNEGYTQELTMLQRAIVQYFTIGISTIGSADPIAA